MSAKISKLLTPSPLLGAYVIFEWPLADEKKISSLQNFKLAMHDKKVCECSKTEEKKTKLVLNDVDEEPCTQTP